MKKLLVGGTLLIVLLLFGTPLIVGLVVGKIYPTLVSTPGSDQPDVAVELLEFDRGWFSSRARHRVTLNAPGVRDWLQAFGINEYQFEFEDTLRHGILPFGADTLRPVIMAGGGRFQHTGGSLSGEWSYWLALDGEPTVTLRLDPVDAEGPMGYWRTSGAELSLSANRAMDDIAIALHHDALSLLGPGPSADFSEATLNFDWDDGEGTLRGTVKGLLQGDLRLGDFQLDADVRRQGEWLEVSADVSDGNFGLGEEDYGALTAELALSNLEARGVDAIFARITGPAKSPEQRRAAVLGELIGQAPVLLAQRPRLDVQTVTLDGPFGRAEAGGYLELQPPNSDALRDPMQLIQFLDADLRADIPERLAHSLMRYRVDSQTGNRLESDELDVAAERALQRLRGEGLFVLRDDTYVMRASRVDGVTTINGQKLALPDG